MRLCPACASAESVAPGEPLWPAGWRCRACGLGLASADGIPLLKPELADTPTGYDAEMFEFHFGHEERHFWFVARQRLIVWALGRFFPDARSFMEIGCGNGPVLAAVAAARPDLRLTGTELHPKGLALARARLGERAGFVQMDARAISLRDELDVIGAFDVIEHIAEDEAVLAQMFAALRPGGGALVAVPQHPFLWSAADERLHHVRRYRRGELEAKMRAAGFDIVWSSSYTALLLPLMAASRLASRVAGRVRPESGGLDRGEFALSGPLNAALGAVQRVEFALTRAGVRWPAGGSRFVAGRKPAGS